MTTTGEGLDADASSYNLLVRVFAKDVSNGQDHSRDYSATIPGLGTATPPPTSNNLTCSHQSGWNENADDGLGAPINPNSFADYEESLASCGTAMSFTAADMAAKTFVTDDETIVLNALEGAAGTESSRGTGTITDSDNVINFNWYVEAASCSGCTHNYLVQYSDSTIDSDLTLGFFLRDASALTDVTGTLGSSGAEYFHHKYSEATNFSDTDRATGSDGEIWHSTDVLQ